MELDAMPKIDMLVDHKPVGQLGLAKFPESMLFNETTDYSDSDTEDEAENISEGVPVQTDKNSVPAKRTSARLKLANQAGDFHKRTRLT